MGREGIGPVISRTRRLLTLTGGLSNGLGGSVVFTFAAFLAPSTLDAQDREQVIGRSVPVFLVFAPVALALGWQFIQRRPWARIERWLRAGQAPTESERELVLRLPRNWALQVLAVWIFGAMIFAAISAPVASAAAAVGLALTIVLGGLTAASVQYLFVERSLRPVTAIVLADGVRPRTGVPGVRTRLTMAWTLATGVPVLGIAVFAGLEVMGAGFERERIIGAALFLSLLALAVGLAAILFAARSVSDPLESMRDALARVEAGDFETRVPVDDGSEVGLLQAGFNRMTAGLAERERLRQAFGAYVDSSLTERVLREGTDLAGEEVELSLLFMDVRGFTAFSEQASASQVVAQLNDLYSQAVPIVLAHGGHANKFIGDGLLAVFGAPDRLADHADRAVAAALQITRMVEDRYAGDLRVGVGVNSGRVVAGTIGGGGRLDFTVIGDAVNTAARVEAATRQTGDDLLITEATFQLLGGEHGDWIARPPVTFKGKSEPVRLYAPVP